MKDIPKCKGCKQYDANNYYCKTFGKPARQVQKKECCGNTIVYKKKVLN